MQEIYYDNIILIKTCNYDIRYTVNTFAYEYKQVQVIVLFSFVEFTSNEYIHISVIIVEKELK